MKLGHVILSPFISVVILTSCVTISENLFSKEAVQIDQMLGCYTGDGEKDIVFKFFENQGKYFASLYDMGEIVETVEVHIGNKSELMNNFELSEYEMGCIKANLIADDITFGIFLVNPGDRFAGKVAKTEYLGALVMDYTSLDKISCK